MKIELGAITLNELTMKAIMGEVDKAMAEFRVDEANGPCYSSRYGFLKGVAFQAFEQILRLQSEVEILKMRLQSTDPQA